MKKISSLKETFKKFGLENLGSEDQTYKCYTADEKADVYNNAIMFIAFEYLRKNGYSMNCDKLIYDVHEDSVFAAYNDGYKIQIDFEYMANTDEMCKMNLFQAQSLYFGIDLRKSAKSLEELSKTSFKMYKLFGGEKVEENADEQDEVKEEAYDGEYISQREVAKIASEMFFGGKLPEGGVHSKHHESLDDLTMAAEDFFNLGLWKIRKEGIKGVQCFLYRYDEKEEMDRLFALFDDGREMDLEYFMVADTDDNKERNLEISDLIYGFSKGDREELASLIEGESRKFFKGEDCIFEPYSEEEMPEKEFSMADVFKAIEKMK